MALSVVTDPEVNSQVIAQWMCERMDDDEIMCLADLGPYRAFGVMQDDKPICGIIWNWWRPQKYGGDVRAIIYAESPIWCLPGLLRELFSYPFDVLEVSRITVVIRDGNEQSLKLCKGLGWRKEGVIRRGYNGKTNCIVMGMLREECKWLNRGNKNVWQTEGPPQERQQQGSTQGPGADGSEGSSGTGRPSGPKSGSTNAGSSRRRKRSTTASTTVG